MNVAPIFLLITALTHSVSGQVLFSQVDASRPDRTIDILHYALDLQFDENRKVVEGTSSITFNPINEPLDSILLDGVAMTIASVRHSDGHLLRHSTDGRTVTIYLSPEAKRADTATVTIAYSCTPESGLYFIQPDSSDLTRRWQIWTQGEESDNRHWFPCYDAPDDKATSELKATVRSAYTLVSNGELLSMTEDTARGLRTFHWRQNLPHSSYLIMLAAGVYSIVEDEGGRFPISHYVYPADSAYAHAIYRRTREIIEYFEQITGFSYPWEKYVHIILDEFMWGGMENTSAVTLNDVYLYDERASLDFSADAVIAHEAAHQWWGNVVTCADWLHLWLNEGFANYYESLFKRADTGRDADLFEAAGWVRAIEGVETRSGRRPIVSKESYTTNLYSKGAWVLRMLAKILGEDQLLGALSLYLQTHAFEPVTTEHLILSLEQSTGQDLRWFFDQWVYGTGIPELSISARWSQATEMVHLTVRQEQEADSLTGIFRFPVDVEITTASGRNVYSVWVEAQEETFSFPVDGRPLMVIFDKGRSLLHTNSFAKTESEWLYQLIHASDGVDRIDAANQLSSSPNKEEIFAAFGLIARKDPMNEVRRRATELLSDSESGKVPALLMEIYGDPDARVRNAAIRGLQSHKTEQVAQFVQQAALTDSSYYVLASCVRTLAAIDPARGFSVAEQFIDLDSHRDIVRREALNAFRTIKDPRAIPLVIPIAGPRYERTARRTALAVLGEIGEGDPDARDLMMRVASGPLADLRNAAVRAIGSWEDSSIRAFLEERAEQEDDEMVLVTLREILDGEKKD